MKTIRTCLLALVVLCTMASCSKDEQIIAEEANYTIDINLANETDWAFANDILYLVNEHRATIGLAAIKRDQGYASAYAVDHTQYMIEKNQISHDNFGIRSSALKEQGASVVSENVAFGYETAEDVVTAWLNSENHRKAIEGPYTHSGFGVIANTNGTVFFTQLFYKK